MKAILNDKYYNVEEEESKYLVQTCSQTKSSGIKIPEVHGAKKSVDSNLRPEWIVKRSQKLAEKSRIEQDERISPIQENQVRNQLGSGQRKDIRKPQIEYSANRDIEQNRENIPKHVYNPQEIKVPIYPNQITKPPPKPPD